jgi:chitinase
MATSFRFRRADDWGHGLVGYVTLTPDAALSGWTLAFDASFDIVNIWGAQIVSHTGTRYFVRSLDWTAQVAASGSVSFGFQASYAGSAPDPTGFVLNPGIVEDPPLPPALPAIALADATAAEDDGFLTFVVTLSHASATPVQFRATTEAGTARVRTDFLALDQIFTFAPGETRKEIRVALVDNAAIESREQLSLRLSEVTGAITPDPLALGTIIDNDAPRISIADAAMIEGDAGTAILRFTVSLSHAVTTSVGVKFSAADITALSGSDYVGRSGGVIFAAGEVEKTISIAIRGDRIAEADETFLLRLHDPVRGVLADAEAVGTIRNNDLPRLSIADAAPVNEGDAGESHAMQGVLSTRGNQIIDATGTPVRIAAVNWFGLETATMAPHGLHTRNWKDMMDQMAEQGFNAIRLPFSGQAILENGTPNGIDFSLNPDLVGLSSLQLMDKIIGYAGEIGLRILLDHHRSFAGDGPNGNGLWYDGRFTEARWIDMWEDLAARYRGNPTVIGADLQNEPHAASWDAWASAAERAGNAILAVNPDWLIVVEGVSSHAGQSYWWGGNLIGARDRPVDLIADNKLVYSPHDYPNSIYPQPFFYAADFPNNMPGIFDKFWGYLWSEDIAPVLLGEWGTRMTQPKDLAWFEAISSYLQGDTDNNGTIDHAEIGPSFAWWSWNPNSTDTGGILADDWRTVLTQKIQALEPLLPDEAEAPRRAVFEVTMDAASASAVTVGWRTINGTATGADYVAATGTLTFAPGETRKTVEILLRPDDLAEAQEAFSVQLTTVDGATFADRLGVAQILDDDGAAARVSSDWAF